MPLLDLFGVKKLMGIGKPEPVDSDPVAQEIVDRPEMHEYPDSGLQPDPVPAPGPGQPRSKKVWGVLLIINSLVFMMCLSYIGLSVLQRGSTAPRKKQIKAKESVKKKERSEKKSEVKMEAEKENTVAKKQEPQKPIEKKTPEKPVKPTGSPALHAPDLPSPSDKKPEPAKPQPAPAPAAKPIPASKPTPERATRPVTFDYLNPEAKNVSLVGMFLISSGGSKAMFNNGSGTWQVTIYLKTGLTYRYQFEVIDKSGKKTLTPVKTINVP